MTEQVQERTKFTHDVSFQLVTEVDMEAMQSSFDSFVAVMSARKEAGEELSDFEEELVAAFQAGDKAQAVKEVIKVSFTEYLMHALAVAAQSVSNEYQSTEFTNIAVEIK